MTKEQFIEKYKVLLFEEGNHTLNEFTSDLNSLFNLRTETRTPEEVRERLKDAEENFFGGVRLRDIPSVQEEISLLKWFLKE